MYPQQVVAEASFPRVLLPSCSGRRSVEVILIPSWIQAPATV